VRASAVGLILAMAVPAERQEITWHGFAAVRVGSSVADASVAAGEQLVEAKDFPSGTEGCYHVRLKSSPSVVFMVEEGHITRVETADPSFSTHSGVRVGDSEVKVRQIYGRRLKVMAHKYDEVGHYLVVYAANRQHALVMETDGRKVVYIRAGIEPSAEYVEGCS
jgi:hypothetical protein